MKFAILAAGEGSRLQAEGIAVPKPLVTICGEAMIDRLTRIFLNCGAEEIVVITNNLTPLTEQHIRRRQAEGLPLRLIVKTTPSSMHSFYELMPYLEGGKFCLTTVDTIFREAEFREYIETFKRSFDDGLMAVTDFIDDEKPLYISTSADLRITGFHDEAVPGVRYISGGIYCLTPRVLPTLRRCIEQGMSRMRRFQREMIADGLRLTAYPFTKIMDVDHAADIAKAEAWIG